MKRQVLLFVAFFALPISADFEYTHIVYVKKNFTVGTCAKDIVAASGVKIVKENDPLFLLYINANDEQVSLIYPIDCVKNVFKNN